MTQPTRKFRYFLGVQHFKIKSGIMTHHMDSKDIDKFLGALYNFWKTRISIIGPRKFNLKKVKHHVYWMTLLM